MAETDEKGESETDTRVEIDDASLVGLLRLATGELAEGRHWYSMADCADARGLPHSYFYHRKHLLPGFGVFEDPAHKRVRRESFMSWMALSLGEHERRWNALAPREQQDIERRR
jgi:hypothetical protein